MNAQGDEVVTPATPPEPQAIHLSRFEQSADGTLTLRAPATPPEPDSEELRRRLAAGSNETAS